MKKLKQKALSHIFPHYPYKKRHAPNITRPAIKNWEFVEDHELSLNWSQWKILSIIYLKLIGQFLLSGSPVTLPNRMGIFKMYKYKYPDTTQRPDFNHYRKTGEWKLFKNNHTNGYGPIVYWHRGKNQGDFRRKWFWSIRLNRTYKKYLSKEIKKNPSLLFSYDDVPRN